MIMMEDFFDNDETVAIGIDLGTRNSVVAKFNGQNNYTFLTENGHSVIKSALFFNSANDIIFGERAETRGMLHPQSLLRCFKRGLTNNEGHMNNGRYVVKGYQDGVQLELTPVDVSRTFLTNLIDRFNIQNNLQANRLILTVPAKFGPNLCEALHQAGMDIGMTGVMIVQEPVAAAICYDFEVEHIPNNSNLLVYDLGAGTFDISLLTRNQNGILEFTDASGDVHLGGEDFTNEVIKYGKESLFNEEDFDLNNISQFKDEQEYAYNIERLRRTAEQTKETLSLQDLYNDPITFRVNDEGVSYDWIMTRNQLNQKISNYINHSIDKINLLLKRNQMTTEDIHKVLVVGGSSLIPLVETKLVEFFKNKDKIITNADRELMIGKGAAIIAYQIFNEEQNELEQAIRFSGVIQKVFDTIGIAVGNSYQVNTIIPRGTNIPYTTTLHYPLNQLLNNQKRIHISFYSYDELEINEDRVLTHNPKVEYIGKCMSQDMYQYSSTDQVDIQITIDNEYIISVQMKKDGQEIYSGFVRRDGVL